MAAILVVKKDRNRLHKNRVLSPNDQEISLL